MASFLCILNTSTTGSTETEIITNAKEGQPGAVVPASAEKAELLEHLLKLNDKEAFWLLEQWMQREPMCKFNAEVLCKGEDDEDEVIIDANGPGPVQAGKEALQKERTDSSRVSRKVKHAGSSVEDLGTPYVQFNAPIYFVQEQTGKVITEVMRIGDTSARSLVDYETVDAEAKAGIKYIASKGTLVFEPGEIMKEIPVEVVNDDEWSTCLEFKVTVSPNENCHTQPTTSQCRVKIIDNDVFPTNKYAQQILDRAYDTFPSSGLLMEYVKMNLTNPIVWHGSLKVLVADQVKNIFIIVRLFCNLMLVDKILKIKDGSAAHLLLLVIAGQAAFFPVIHYLDFRKVYWKIGGTSRKILMANLLRKFLNYNDESRQEVDTHELLMAMKRDVHAVVINGYMKMFPLLASLSRIVLIVMYQLALPALTGREFPSPISWLLRLTPTIVFPPAVFFFLASRKKRTLGTLRTMFEAEDELIYDVSATVQNYRLIADYKVRQYFVDRFDTSIAHFNKAFVDAGAVKANNMQFAPWVTLFLASLFTYYGGNQVTNDQITVGEFLNTFAVINELGRMWQRIFENLLEILDAIPSLETLATFMNYPTDLVHRMNLADEDRRYAKKILPIIQADSHHSEIVFHKLPIVLRNIKIPGKSIIPDMDIQLQQGMFYAIMGGEGQGKTTLLKVIGNALLPQEKQGVCYIPTHLSTLHVSSEPMFFKGTLWENITFAANKWNREPQRVERILKTLGLPQECIEVVLDSSDKAKVERFWSQQFSQTELCMLSLARALIVNPELLCLHKPTVCFQDHVAEKIAAVLSKFVEKRGLEQSVESFHERAYRTCIVTTARMTFTKYADAVVHVVQGRGISMQWNHPDKQEEEDQKQAAGYKF